MEEIRFGAQLAPEKGWHAEKESVHTNSTRAPTRKGLPMADSYQKLEFGMKKTHGAPKIKLLLFSGGGWEMPMRRTSAQGPAQYTQGQTKEPFKLIVIFDLDYISDTLHILDIVLRGCQGGVARTWRKACFEP